MAVGDAVGRRRGRARTMLVFAVHSVSGHPHYTSCFTPLAIGEEMMNGPCIGAPTFTQVLVSGNTCGGTLAADIVNVQAPLPSSSCAAVVHVDGGTFLGSGWCGGARVAVGAQTGVAATSWLSILAMPASSTLA